MAVAPGPARVDPARILNALQGLSAFRLQADSGVTRRGFSREDAAAREAVVHTMRRELGLSIRSDAAANLFGRMEGTVKGLPPIWVGSHLDTVPQGGMFDGPVGVVLALEVTRFLRNGGRRLRHPLEVAIFTAEEPSVFGISTFGSRAIAGHLDADALRGVRSGTLRLEDALRSLGGDLERLEEARRPPGSIAAFLEVHIEQGRSLWDTGVPMGVVTQIVGITRHRILITGEANHAGTTPMESRRDALTAAAEIILAVERLCRASRGDLVGTVGHLTMTPNAPNIIPGRVELVAELRSPEEENLERAWGEITKDAEAVAGRRGLRVELVSLSESPPVAMDAEVIEVLECVCRRRGTPYLRLPSYAGHDAGHLATVTRSGMLFVPSREGKSHCPEEWSDPVHIALAGEVLLEAILELDRRLDHPPGPGAEEA